MITSPLLKSNPNLYVFLPLFYMVWEDAVLTPSEVKKIHEIIDLQDWLTSEERSFLLEQINPASPPSPDELKTWLSEIQQVRNQLSAETKDSLVDIGVKLASLHTSSSSFSEATRQSLSHIEDTLGIISHEATFLFHPQERKTITSQYGTQHTFDVEILNQLLDGKQASIIKKVKTVISDPEFRYIDTDNLGINNGTWIKLSAGNTLLK